MEWDGKGRTRFDLGSSNLPTESRLEAAAKSKNSILHSNGFKAFECAALPNEHIYGSWLESWGRLLRAKPKATLQKSENGHEIRCPEEATVSLRELRASGVGADINAQ
jgi:hypothetical protein